MTGGVVDVVEAGVVVELTVEEVVKAGMITVVVMGVVEATD